MAVTTGGPVAPGPPRLFALLAALLFTAVATSLGYGWLAARHAARIEDHARDQATAGIVAHEVAEHFAELENHIGEFAGQAALNAALTHRDRHAAEAELAQLRRRYPSLLQVGLCEPDGTLWAAAQPVPELYGQNFASRAWYRQVRAAGRPVISPLYVRTMPPLRPVIGIAAPVREARGRVRAYLVAQQSLDELTGWLAALHSVSQGQVLLYDSKDQLVSKTVSDLARPTPWQGVLRAARRGQLPDGADAPGFAAVAASGWSVLVIRPADNSHGPPASGFAWFGAALLALLLLGTYLLHRGVATRQHELQETYRLLAGMIERSADPITAIDTAFRVRAFNRAAAESYLAQFGLPLALGADLLALMAARPEQRESEREHWQRTFAGEPFVVNEDWNSGDKTRTYEMHYYSLTSPEAAQPLIAVQIGHDVSEREHAAGRIKELNLELAHHNAALLAANQELEGFTHTVAHDLRAPVRAIDGYAHLLAEQAGASLDEEGGRLLAAIRSNSKLMGQLIDDLLAYAHLGRNELNPEALDMNVLVDAVWEREGSGFSGDFQLGRLPPADGDRAMMTQLWNQLLANAVKFSRGRPDARVEVSGTASADECIYRVTDNGAGFDMRYAGKLFGIFQRLHRWDEFPGTGVGLAIVARVVARHGGRVWAEGEPGQGASFHFTLPRRPGAEGERHG